MSRRIIQCQVTDEYVRGAGVVVGAAGSHNDVALRLVFGPMWEGTTRSIVWKDALGGNPTVTILGTDLLEPGETEVYIVPIPAEPKAYAGDLSMTIKGAVVEGNKETSATLTARAFFTVMDSDWDENAMESGDITPTQAEQMQAQIDEIRSTIWDAVQSAEKAADSAEQAANSVILAEQSANYVAGAVNIAEESALNATMSAESARDYANSAYSSANSASMSVSSASLSAQNAENSATMAANSESAARSSEISAKESAESASGSAAAAKESETNANSSSQLAQIAKSAANNSMMAAENAKLDAVKAQQAIENMSATGETVPPDSEAPAVEKQVLEDGSINLHFNIRQGFNGVYVGSGDMPDGYNVQVDPDGTGIDIQAVQETAESAKAIAERAESAAANAVVIASGRATGYVFDTLADLETALANEEFVSGLVLGDNLYIRATDVPDYWWDGTQKQQLETEKPDLTGLVKEADVQNMIDASLAAIGVAEGGSY